MKRLAVAVLSGVLTGCGTYVPKISKIKDDQVYTIDVHQSIQCEIIDAVHLAYAQVDLARQVRGRGADFFNGWGILYTLTLNVVEDTSLNPSIDLLNPARPLGTLLPGTSVFTLNTGLKLTAKATRTETDQKFEMVDYYRAQRPCGDSKPRNRIVTFGNKLGISDWFIRRISLVDIGLIRSLTPKESFTHQIKFEIGKRGNFDPRWTFIQRKFNKTGGLFNAGRSRAHTVLITFGPAEQSRIALARDAAAVHNAQLIGDAVRE